MVDMNIIAALMIFSLRASGSPMESVNYAVPYASNASEPSLMLNQHCPPFLLRLCRH